MHHLRSTRAIFHFRASALLLLAKALAGITGVGFLGVSVFNHDPMFSRVGAGFLALGVVLAFLQWLAASSARCPLCLTQVLARKGCAKHRKARRILGSHRLPVVVRILTKERFCCPYCHEMTELSLRRR